MALNINGTTGISGVDGSVSAPAVTGTDSNTGITFPAADTIKFSTGGVERLQITNSGCSGTGLGKILQVVSGIATSQASQASSGTSFADTGLTASITPSATSSKILVMGYVSYSARTTAGQNGSMEWNFAVCDGSNNILDGTTAETDGYRINESYILGGKHPINFLHSPGTASAFTYKIRMNARNSNNTMSLYCQYAGAHSSRIVLMEVAV